MKNKIMICLLSLIGTAAVLGQTVMTSGAVLQGAPMEDRADVGTLDTRELIKSKSGNPMLGFDAQGGRVYSGDPSILVDGDTVYCYTGHDTATYEGYRMPEWLCYSTKDMVNWKYEGEIMKNSDVSWAHRNYDAAWASQVAEYNGKYYLYYCTEDNGSNGGGKCIGVAVADSPTGPFADIGKPLVRNIDTSGSVHSWEDIDPTIWVEEDENGQTRRYLGWGNTRFFICELEEDMISVKDLNGDGQIKMNDDIILGKINGMGNHGFTEAPYYYRQKNEEGKYYGPYYMFFATDWREQMAYCTTDDIMSNEWEYGGLLMEPSATANTNHMAVFDFQKKTYFVYHDGSLPGGSGYRRVACVEEMTINPDGTIDPIKKTATGLTGTSSQIFDFNGEPLAHEEFENTLNDGDYPIIHKGVFCGADAGSPEASWEINPGKSDVLKEEYVSIESNNKPGLYLAVSSNDKTKLVLSQDVKATADEADRMTFRTLEGIAGSGVTFESVKYPGYYLTSSYGELSMTENPQEEDATFYTSGDIRVQSFQALKTKRLYGAGDTLNLDDIKVTMYLENGQCEEIRDYTTNGEQINMNTIGDKILRVSYKKGEVNYGASIAITVVEKEYFGR